MKYLEEYLTYLKVQKNYSDKTITSYKIDIEEFFSYLDKECLDLLNVKYNDIHMFLNLLQYLQLVLYLRLFYIQLSSFFISFIILFF